MSVPETLKPNTARDLLLIHRIITRALEVSQEKGQEYLSGGFPNAITRQGYHDYLHCLVMILNAHHLTEDELIFPQFGVRIASAPYKLLTEDHHKMVVLLDKINASLELLSEDGNNQELESILNNLQQLKTMWYPHIGIEQSYFSENNINQAMTTDEQQTISQQASKHSQELATPDYLIVPFLLYNLTPIERTVFSAPMPPVVTQQLVPQVWKDKWIPMQPFLLVD